MKMEREEGLKKKPVKTICEWLCNFRPPLVLSVFGAFIFSALSLIHVSTDFFEAFPAVIHYIVYVCAAIFLSFAVWSLILYLKHHSLKQLFLLTAGKNPFSSNLVYDYSYRTMMVASCSLLLNILLTLFKMVTGWYYASTWLMVLSGYYIMLIITKFMLISYGKKQSNLTDKTARITHEWKAYRLCGIMLIVLTFFLQGIVIMIIKEGHGFSYHEIVVITIAAYDFYCLGSSIFYMITKRKKHSPIINSIKYVSFASSLAAILSLQTAMFASFGEKGDTAINQYMNIATGTVVCVTLIVLGIIICKKANKELNQIVCTYLNNNGI